MEKSPQAMDIRQGVDIVGAGPAGMAAAIYLRKHKVKVRLYELASKPGSRFKGDFQGLENWTDPSLDVLEELADYGIEANFEYLPVKKCTFLGNENQKATIEAGNGRPLFYLVRRGVEEDTLDHALYLQCLKAGVEVHLGQKKSYVDKPTIVATGPRRPLGVVYGMNFETDGETRIVGLLDQQCAPWAYGYLLTHGGKGTVATVIPAKRADGWELLARTAQRIFSRIPAPVRNPCRFSGVGAFGLVHSARRGMCLYVGEAAGFQDFLWGFGMRIAIRSSILAARSLLYGQDYDELWRKELLPWMKTSHFNRIAWMALALFQFRYLFRLMKIFAKNPHKLLYSQYRPNYIKLMLQPIVELVIPCRWKIPGCNHANCNNLYCRCSDEEAHKQRACTCYPKPQTPVSS